MDKKGNPFIILLIAVAIIAIVSLLPLSRISGGKLKDYNLISDLIRTDSIELTGADTYIDPDLEKALAEIEPQQAASPEFPSPETEDTEIHDIQESKSVSKQPEYTFEVGKIEDYTENQRGLRNLKNAINSSNGQPARIAMLGDSYIEGDILSEVIREHLQDKYGGSGAGYVPAFTNIPGFRNSIRQNCSNWKELDFRKRGQNFTTLSGFSFKPDGAAKTVIKGSKKATHTSNWTQSRILYISPDEGQFKFYSSADNSDPISTTASSGVQCYTLPGNTSEVTFESSTPDLNVLGIFLDGESGVALDNMSIRGYAGIRHDILNLEIARQASEFIDYKLIILEFGINALTAEQTDYSGYCKVVSKSVDRLREAYPNADILLLGIGDRGIKQGTEVISMPTVKNMVAAQRKLAKDKGLLFFDTCAAMGGQGAVVEWASRREINKDYIHLSRKGGDRLGKIIAEAIETCLDE